MKASTKYSIDLVFWTLVTFMALYLRVDNWNPYLDEVRWLALIGLPLKAFTIYFLGHHKRSWHRVGIPDLIGIIAGVGAVTFVLFVVNMFAGGPRSLPIIEGALAIIGFGGLRILARVVYEQKYKRIDGKRSKVKRVLMLGAGEAGTRFVRELMRHPQAKRKPIGYLDDDDSKQSQRFVGLPVFGKIKDLPEIAEQYEIDEVLIAIPSERNKMMREIIDLARQAGTEYHIVPGIEELATGKISVSTIRDVDVEDLLKRPAIQINNPEIEAYLTNKTILITGAGGSIGSEIVRQVSRFNPKLLVLLGRGENSIYEIEQEMRRNWANVPIRAVIADVKELDKLETIFAQFQPDVIFHAAAHKHVPLMEAYPDEAVLNNIGGTRNLIKLALKYEVNRFVNISTDKAVNPTSIMGASKRVSEYVVSEGAKKAKPNQSFMSVRFGNVLGSRGSVVPLFKRQIQEGGPITVTHPEMTRYFMTIPEASQLVIQAGALNENGNVYVLDMGEPVKIVDLAKDLILLSGFEPHVDIEIKFSGMRPGEKLFEELLTAEEGTSASKHQKIFVAKNSAILSDLIDGTISELFQSAKERNTKQIYRLFKTLIPSFKPDLGMLEEEKEKASI